MPAPDARTRNKVNLNPAKILTTSIPSKLIPNLLAADVLHVLALQLAKEWLLDFDVGVFWVVMRVLACGGVGVLGWEVWSGQLAKRSKANIEWSSLAMAGVLLFVQQACLFTALYRLSSARTLMFTYFSKLWIFTFASSSARKIFILVLASSLAIFFDTYFSANIFWRYVPGYGALLLHGLATAALDHTVGVLSPSLGETFTRAVSVLGASIVALPFYAFKTIALHFPPSPVLPLTSLAIMPFVSYTLLFFTPLAMGSLGHQIYSRSHFSLSFPTAIIASAILGPLAFTHLFRWSDFVIAALLYIGMYPEHIDAFAARPRTPTSQLVKLYTKTILSNPESRKIFYFLLLNLCYMLVQMLYGVWTNSLGLISDAIHMAFDCMAIGVGLFASVMATWEPNERFTYGYGRIETLSGFANGIFLILISIFIVFEAIQRILEPPEMDTNQLLLVSVIGLGVNLFGMFAMGGHHHHGGHSHSHGHGHGHGHGHSHSHSHSHSHTPMSSSHIRAPVLSPEVHTLSMSPEGMETSHSHSHSHPYSHSDTHSHSHSLSPLSSSHSPVEFPKIDHSHSHSDDNANTHSHSSAAYSHSHNRTVSFSPVTSPIGAGHSLPLPKHQRSLSLTINGFTKTGSAPLPLHLSPPLQQPSRHSRSPSLQTPSLSRSGARPIPPPLDLGSLESEGIPTPITPTYKFVDDEHLAKHHDGHSHGHGHSDGHGHEGHSHNMRGVFLHVMADTLGSVGVIVSTLLIQFYGWTGFDPIASLFIAVLIAASVVPLVLDTGKILCLDIADRDVVIQEAISELSSVQGVASFSNPRFWPKDASSLIGSIHIQIAPSTASHDPAGPHSNQHMTYMRIDKVVERVQAYLKEKIPGLEELTIQVEEGSCQ